MTSRPGRKTAATGPPCPDVTRRGVRPALCRFRQPDRGAARGTSGMTPVSGNAALRSVTLGNLSFSVTPSEACMSLFRRKSLDSVTVHEAGRRLIPTLSWPHLIALGIGAIVGTGIYTLIGVGANLVSPAVLISFAIAGAVCACAALSYAELSTMMPTRLQRLHLQLQCARRGVRLGGGLEPDPGVLAGGEYGGGGLVRLLRRLPRMGAHPVRLERAPASLAGGLPARGRRHDQSAA